MTTARKIRISDEAARLLKAGKIKLVVKCNGKHTKLKWENIT